MIKSTLTNELVLDFMKTSVISTKEFTDDELYIVLDLLNYCGLESLNDVEGYRHHEYFGLSYSESLDKISKCKINRSDRVLITKEQFLEYFGLDNVYDFYLK